MGHLKILNELDKAIESLMKCIGVLDSVLGSGSESAEKHATTTRMKKMALTTDEKLHFAAARGMTIEEYEEFLEAASTQVIENILDHPEGVIEVDPDVAEHMALEAMGQEVDARTLEEFAGSVTDAALHEEQDEEEGEHEQA